ncbi:DUF2281 domain-containing protein [Scytonema sp. UIC 10036]|nr:DUF2281 domain-containing protein [Scytonema sp. UIC 10036]
MQASLIETLPPELLTEALDLIREIKNNYIEKHSSTNKLTLSTAEDLLEFAGTWEGNDIRECLQLVHDTRMPLEF